ncbi:MAG: hypothetical protein WD738_22845 [Pirellulales bacterium]
MIMQEITIRVTPDAAAAYLSASDEERRKLDALLSLRLTEASQRNRPLREVIQEISREAQAKGLTPEILQEILDGR